MNCRICGGYVTANSCVICGSYATFESLLDIVKKISSSSAPSYHTTTTKSLPITHVCRRCNNPIEPSQIHDEVMISDECDRCEALAERQLYSPPPPQLPSRNIRTSNDGYTYKSVQSTLYPKVNYTVKSSESFCDSYNGYTFSDLLIRDKWNRHEYIRTEFSPLQREVISANWSKRLRERIAQSEKLERNKVTIDNSFYDDYEY